MYILYNIGDAIYLCIICYEVEYYIIVQWEKYFYNYYL